MGAVIIMGALAAVVAALVISPIICFMRLMKSRIRK